MKREPVVVVAAVVFLLPLHFLSRSQAFFKRAESDKVIGASEVACNASIYYISCAFDDCKSFIQASCHSEECEKCSATGATYELASSNGPKVFDVDFTSNVPINGECGLNALGYYECEWKDGACMCPVSAYDEHFPCASQAFTIYNSDCMEPNPPPPEPF